MKRTTLIAFLISFMAPAIAFADPGHPAMYEAFEWLHYFTSVRHVIGTMGGIVLMIGIYKIVRYVLSFKRETIKK